jgi:hypothetical protein
MKSPFMLHPDSFLLLTQKVFESEQVPLPMGSILSRAPLTVFYQTPDAFPESMPPALVRNLGDVLRSLWVTASWYSIGHATLISYSAIVGGIRRRVPRCYKMF